MNGLTHKFLQFTDRKYAIPFSTCGGSRVQKSMMSAGKSEEEDTKFCFFLKNKKTKIFKLE